MNPTTPVTMDELLNLLNLIRPWHMASHTKTRIGAPHDGGYVLPASARETNLVFSIGIGDEVSFDAELANLGAKVFQFDHTIEKAPLEHPNIRYFRKGWGTQDAETFISTKSMMSLADWGGARHPILKFDVEGAEWAILDAVDVADLAKFEMLTGEFHDFANLIHRDYFDRVRRVWTKLGETHRVVHLHANNAGGIFMLQGIPFPRLLELSYMRKDAAVFGGLSTEPIPGPLDRPNIPQLPDLNLRPF